MSVCSNGKMFVADRNNNRVMVFNRVPTANGAAADFVIGQPDFVMNGAATTATGLNHPYAAYCMANKLFVVEQGNHRILVFDPISHGHQSHRLLCDWSTGYGHGNRRVHGKQIEQSV